MWAKNKISIYIVWSKNKALKDLQKVKKSILMTTEIIAQNVKY